ncbi:MAG TPA: OmpA family protein [Candidatus Polarisedimenticolia bacterium]|jgi:outer membrane protein OmpA-like peptidoglycan-associated protein|nr:OmpA family protein [Candidatus Polarisedimenticolia bacterium]
MQRQRATLTLFLLAAATVVSFSAARPARGQDRDTSPMTWSSAGDVTEAQKILESMHLLASGTFKSGTLDGPTHDALVAFQTSHTLRPTGMLDFDTEAELLQHRPGKDSDGDGVPDANDKCPNTPKGAVVDANGCPKDSDGDGIMDGFDKCPDTRKELKVDASGCPVDSDGDGVLDGLDQCPDTPRGAKVDSRGCSIDSDGDGVADNLDKCPDTPHGTKVDSNGCPVVEDSDGDGVPDDRDRCPDTPRGTKVDAQGCVLVAAAPAALPLLPEAKKSVVLEGVTFETNSSHLKPESAATLDRVAESLKANPDVRVEIGGHTDSQGADAHNMQLSRDRANSVRAYLLDKGVSPVQLEAKGYGETRPIADNNSAAGRARNRRVELKRID